MHVHVHVHAHVHVQYFTTIIFSRLAVLVHAYLAIESGMHVHVLSDLLTNATYFLLLLLGSGLFERLCC